MTVFTAGVWDLFHVGHLNLLRNAARLGDSLQVGVLTDEAAAAYKETPVIPFIQRIRIIQNLDVVTQAVGVNNTDATELMQGSTMVPEDIVLVHGDDHTPDWEIGQTWVQNAGGLFVLLPYTAGISTTSIKERIKAKGAK